jgi:hypothetical protein
MGARGEIKFDTVAQRHFIKLKAVARYDATSDLEMWQKSFSLASQYLFDATKGQVQIKEVAFVNNGTMHNSYDVKLTPDNGANDHSRSWNYDNRQLDSIELAKSQLTWWAMTEPLELAHELAHIAFGLVDEYWSNAGLPATPLCTKDAGSGASIMEFASRYGIVLTRTQGGPVTQSGPLNNLPITQFCYPATNPGHNYEHMHGNQGYGCRTDLVSTIQCKSCWEIIDDNFTEIVIPQFSGAVVGSHDSIDWIESKNNTKTTVAVFGIGRLGELGVIKNVKESLLGRLKILVGNGDELSIVAQLPSGAFVRNMDEISPAELDGLVNSILTLEDSNNGGDLSLFGSNQFESEAQSAHQSLILVLPGDETTSGPEAREFFLEFGEALEEISVDMTVLTYGDGELASILKEVHGETRRIRHIHVSAENSQIGNFHVQNILNRLYFEDSPGLGIVSTIRGEIPVDSARDLLDIPDAYDHPVDALLLHPQAEGIDFPAYIESGATSAYFMLSLADDDEAEFTLLNPSGEPVNADSNNVIRSNADGNVKFLEVGEPLEGRWIIRVRRKLGADIENRKSVPFEILVGARNPALIADAKIQIREDVAEFQAYAEFENRLDFVDYKVELYNKSDWERGLAPVNTLILNRERVQRFPISRATELDEEPPKPNKIAVSSGVFVGKQKLNDGDYIAVFTVTNHGQAVFANNPGKQTMGFESMKNQPAVPPFTRTYQIAFTVSAQTN